MPPRPVRIPPISRGEFTEEQAELAGQWDSYNFTRVMVQHPALYRVFRPLGEKLMGGSALPPRDREVLVLRTLALCGENYEAPHHIHYARGVGMSDADIEAAKTGGSSLSPFEQVLVKAVDELVHDHCVRDATWKTLAEKYSRIQLMEVVFLVGEYTMMSMVTNSFGMQIEDAQ